MKVLISKAFLIIFNKIFLKETNELSRKFIDELFN